MPDGCWKPWKLAMIDLNPNHLATVKAILKEHVPECEIRAFGSRAVWTAKDYSDLDLAVVGTGPLGWRTLGRLKEAFEESTLPMRVDVLDWHAISERFQRVIQRNYVVVKEGIRQTPTEEWRNTTLGTVADFLSGGTPRRARSDYWDGSIPWVSAKDMKTFQLHETGDKVTATGAANGTRMVPANTVMVLVRGMTLLNNVPICVTQRPMTFNQDVKALRPKSGVSEEFLPYLILSNRDRLLGLVDLAGHGTGRLNTEEVKGLDVYLPPLPEQRAIAHVLGTLDDKIELNRRMNETLEEMARALFKSWFVDFDPVRAKLQGRDTGLPPDISDLFPNRLAPSELGEIPEGWEVKTLTHCAVLNPESWSRSNTPAAINYVDLTNVKWGAIEATHHYRWKDAPSRAKRILRSGDTIVGTVRPGNGSYHLVGTKGLTGSTGFAVLRPLHPRYREFVYLSSTSTANIERLAHLADGAAYPAVRANAVAEIEIASPKADKHILNRFSKTVAPLINKIKWNEADSRTLSAQRDALLPKLVSGEMNVGRDGRSIQ